MDRVLLHFKQAKDFIEELNRRGLSTWAASCAFYLFLSLFPMAALATSLLPCVGISQAALLPLLNGLVPSGVEPVLKAILNNVYERVFPVLPASILALIWAAAKSFSELLKGMVAMVEPGRRTGYFSRRLRAMLLTLVLMTALPLTLTVLLFGVRLTLLLGHLFPKVIGLLTLMLKLRHVWVSGMLWLLLILLYRSIPGQSFTFREAMPAAALVAGSSLLFSTLFTFYSTRYFNLTLYGGMSAMALTMLWLLYCQYIILIGAGICGWTRSKKEAAAKGQLPEHPDPISA